MYGDLLNTIGFVETADPEVGGAMEAGTRTPAPQPGADRFRKHCVSCRYGRDGHGTHQQIRRGLPGQPLLRRLRVRGRGGGHRHASGPASCSAPSMPMCSPIPAHRRTWPSISPCCKPGDTVMGMNLDHGGHLTHGSPVNISGQVLSISCPTAWTPRPTASIMTRCDEHGHGAQPQTDRRRALALIPARSTLQRFARDRRRGAAPT